MKPCLKNLQRESYQIDILDRWQRGIMSVYVKNSMYNF